MAESMILYVCELGGTAGWRNQGRRSIF